MNTTSTRRKNRSTRGIRRTRPRPSVERVEDRLLMATSFLQGYVTGPANLPLLGATVTLQPVSPPGAAVTATTNPDGYYRFDVDPGTYRLTEAAPGLDAT